MAGAGYSGYQAYQAGQAAKPQYVTAGVQKGTLVVSVTGSGQMTDSNQTNIQAQGSGNVVSVPVVNNQQVAAGQLLVKLDTTNEDRAVRNAKVSLDSAELQLQILQSPASTSSLLQAQAAVVQSNQSLATSQSNLASDYNNAFTDISNTFIDLPTVMNGLNSILYSQTVNKVQNDVDAYTNLVRSYAPSVDQYNQSAVLSYETALTAYNQNLADYKNVDINSSTSTIESLLSETYGTLKTISIANGNTKNLLDLVSNTLQQNSQKPPAQLALDETSVQSYLTTTNNHLATILQIQNSLAADKQAIVSAGLSASEAAATLAQLQEGPTALQIEQQQLAVTQAENALTDAEANLAHDYARAPFAGVVTDIAAKIGQPPPATLAVLVSNQQLAQATFNETDIVNVKLGQPATVTFSALPDLTLTGKVVEVDTLGAVTQGVVSYNVQVALDGSNASVKPGMSDDIAIVTAVHSDTLLVPNSAVVTRQGVSTVQVMDANGNPHPVTVTVGLANDTDTEILSGLNMGDTVVVRTVTQTSAATQSSSGAGRAGLSGVGGGAVFFRGGGG